MTYNYNIPQPLDRFPDSQPQILANFTQLNEIYGTDGDHYAWNNATPAEQNLHAKVTMPGLPTTNPPGNALPTPLAGQCAIFAQTVSGITLPYLRRDGSTTTGIMLPMVAYASFNGNGGAVAIGNWYNIKTIIWTAVGRYTITLADDVVSNANFGVIITSTQTAGANITSQIAQSYSDPNGIINLTLTNSSNFHDGNPITFLVMQ